MYRSPILAEALFAPPTAPRTLEGVEHSDQILSTRLTRGPHWPKRHVMGAQGQGNRPAAAL